MARYGCLRYFRPGTKERLLAGDTPEWLRRHPRGGYIKQAILSFPPWAFAAQYEHEWARLSNECIRMHKTLDHIIPLNHPRVCGLSVPWNMRAVPREANQHKGNAWCQWHGELFPPKVEQLTMELT